MSGAPPLLRASGIEIAFMNHLLSRVGPGAFGRRLPSRILASKPGVPCASASCDVEHRPVLALLCVRGWPNHCIGTLDMNPAPNIRHILVAHDFSNMADYALSYALVLAEKFDARVTVVHVYEVPTYGYPDAFITSSEWAAGIERAAADSLEEVRARARCAKVDVGVLLRRGTPWAEVTAAAAERKADLIVTGTHGHRGVARALLGSVAEKIVRTAPCPVLTVHLPGDLHEELPAAHAKR